MTLRPLGVDDAESTLRWRSSPRARLLHRGAASVAEQRRWIAARPDDERNFIIELAGAHPVGMLSLVAVDREVGHAETARFLIGDEEAVRGVPVAVEAMKLLYELAFDGLGLHRIYGVIAAENTRMIKWQRYLGMREEGRLRDHLLVDGARQDAVCMGLLEDEYRATALPRMEALIAASRSIA